MNWFKTRNRSKSLDDSPSIVNDIQERGHERIDYVSTLNFALLLLTSSLLTRTNVANIIVFCAPFDVPVWIIKSYKWQ